MLPALGKLKRRLIKRFSRTQLVSRWMGFETDVPESHQPGLIVLQLDGLSRRQFEAAIANRRLPFLKRMIDRRYFTRTSFYSGIPSCTPAVQAEVMYGVKGAVPAFQFLHRRSGQVMCMYESDAAQTVVSEQLCDAEPLLKGGASFSNIYSGGCDEARCCIETADLASTFKGLNPLKLLLMLCMYSLTLVRIGILAVVECVVAIGDMLRGLVTQGDWRSEIKFVPSRVLISIVLREWVRVVVKLSIARGTPIVYVNLLGYDEQSHRRGPDSAFAHWGLKGIDGVIRDIFLTARRADSRDYEVVVFSDHGQEAARIYEFEYGQSVQQAVTKALEDTPLAERIVRNVDKAIRRGSYMDQQMRRLMKIQRGRVLPEPITADELAEHVIVTAMGPIGGVYFPVPVTDDAKAEIADRLVNQEHVPLVLYARRAPDTDGDTEIMARNSRGLWKLTDDIPAVFGVHHRFAAEACQDLLALCHSPNVGDLVLCGWDPDQSPVTFSHENGAHGSIGSEETRGFALFPSALAIEPRKTSAGEAYIRGVDLHAAGLDFVKAKRREPVRGVRTVRPIRQKISPGRLRVLTYNTHHCIGMDGKCRPKRIADVIAESAADVVALQEMDDNRARTNFCDQAGEIAAQLGMYHRFFPVWSEAGERYGLAVLSKVPMQLVREETLTDADHRTRREARGAMWVTVETDDGPVHVLNTHLGLRAKERLSQVDMLLGEHWVAGIPSREPVILCGDFNAGPKSEVMRRLQMRFHCAQQIANDYRPQATFASVLPLRRIDYILLSRHLVVDSVEVIRNHATSVASDHLPVLADVLVHRQAISALRPAERPYPVLNQHPATGSSGSV
ncbi:MAG: endonuclease/exonuclease/phosphatase family protein [Planctomycetaceae bacterium]